MSSDPFPIWLNLVLILVMVLLNAFFVAAEFALVKVRGSRIDALALEGRLSAKYARKILGNLDAYLSACQLGITLASLVLGWLGEPTIARMLKPLLSSLGFSEFAIHTVSFLIAFTIITTLHITLGEQFPKTYAIRKSERVTLLSASPMVLLYRLMYPFIWVLNGISNWLLRMSGVEPTAEHESAHTEEEIRILMQESNRSGLIDNTELALVDNIFEFAETTAREVMIPRTEMVCLYASLSFEENRDIALADMHTRYPVCETDKDSIIGFVHVKDLLRTGEPIELRAILRPITSIPESMPIPHLLKLLQKKRTQMALLIDEYGGTAGIVTVEDILEEIVGEIHDEFDEARPRIERKDEDTFSIDGLLLIEEVNDYFGIDIGDDNYDTIGGWIYSQIEIPPKKNQRVRFENRFEFIVEETDHLRISRLTVRRLEEDEDTPVLWGTGTG
ncbi:membrane protein [Paenibacillus sp. J31TS4]|uniref:hemolysin family protein n=1 Tax=Paenibacillus sp. J31TS4 TaxID=2807195 RepID=UPI001B2A8780|nr:hemolysin family protein [Paenibacillus sp. J31TS4]GIP38474.1 membrane protein [Paenibacillus sp. J31TS4]